MQIKPKKNKIVTIKISLPSILSGELLIRFSPRVLEVRAKEGFTFG